jgi:hypothetical protein
MAVMVDEPAEVELAHPTRSLAQHCGTATIVTAVALLHKPVEERASRSRGLRSERSERLETRVSRTRRLRSERSRGLRSERSERLETPGLPKPVG